MSGSKASHFAESESTRSVLARRVSEKLNLPVGTVENVYDRWESLAFDLLDSCGLSVVPGGLLVCNGEIENSLVGESLPEVDDPVRLLYAAVISLACDLSTETTLEVMDCTITMINNEASSTVRWLPGFGEFTVDDESSDVEPTFGVAEPDRTCGRPHAYWLWVTQPQHLRTADGSYRTDLNPGTNQDGWWTCNKNTRAGDIALVYESGPQTRHIAQIIQVLSDAYPIHDAENAHRGKWSYGCDNHVLARIERPVTLKELRNTSPLPERSALRADLQQRVYAIGDTEWDALQKLLRDKDPRLGTVLDEIALLPSRPRFDYERDIQRRLEHSLSAFRRIDLSLRLYRDPISGRRGAQYVCPAVGIIDLLAVDDRDDLYVIELKRGKALQKDFGQLASYVSWIQNHLAGGHAVTGLLVSDGVTPAWQEAAKLLDCIRHVDLNELGLLP